MRHLNVEIKVRVDDLAPFRKRLEAMEAAYTGTDTQRDTYFAVPEGRLKVREGTIEQGVIFYNRPDQAGPKPSQIERTDPGKALAAVHAVLQAALPVDVVVEKTRSIYWVDQVKVHLDEVPGLGSFVELEAVDTEGTASESDLHAMCTELMEDLHIPNDALVDRSYSDLVREHNDA
jgi:predicted adenylyl cyclase CyaB